MAGTRGILGAAKRVGNRHKRRQRSRNKRLKLQKNVRKKR